MSQRTRLRLGAALALASCLAGPALAQTPQRGGTAIFALSQDPPSVNPAASSGFANRMVGCILFQGLVRVTDDYRILPGMAKSWTVSPDGLTYTFDLQNAKRHDGKPFTSDDVKFSLVEVSAKFSPTFAPAGRSIESVEAPAPDKVVIKLKNSFGPFLVSLACFQGGAITPAHLYRGTDILKNPANVSSPVGTGAFKLAEWKHGDFIRLAKNPDYWDSGKPYLDEVVGKVITQPSTAVQALKSGEIDVLQPVPPNDMAGISANPKLRVIESDQPESMTLAFLNTTRKPLDDKRVRRALFMATDRDYLFKNAFFEVGNVGIMPMPSRLKWAANSSIDYRKMYPFDPARANALLDEAGVKRGVDGKRFTLHLYIYSADYPEFRQVAVALKSMYQAIGVDVDTEAMEEATLVKKVHVERDFDMTMVGYTSFGDPALGFARAFISSTVGRPYGNPSGYSNPVVDELFVKGERALTYEERGPFYSQAQAIIAADLPVFTWRELRNMDAGSTRIHDLWGKIQGNGNWAEAWLEK